MSRAGWPYYARPRLGLTAEVTAAEVTSVLARLRELGVPESIEWVHDNTPSLREAAVAAGFEVEDYPLLVLDGDPVERQSPVDVRRLGPDDPELAARPRGHPRRLRPGRHDRPVRRRSPSGTPR